MGCTRRSPKSPRPVLKGEFGHIDSCTGGRFYGAWECEYCHLYNLTKEKKCHHCGASRVRPAVAKPVFVEPPAGVYAPYIPIQLLDPGKVK